MEIGSPCGKVKSDSSSRSLVNGLDNNLGEFLHIQDSHERNATDGEDINDVEKKLKDLELDESKPCQKGLCKFPTFPGAVKGLPSVTSSDEQDEELETALRRMFSDESVHSPCSRSISLPSPLKLVSAMKGTREKLGASPRKLSVKWAPDVYDPPPTIVSHTVNRGKKQQKLKEERNKKYKNGKKGQKGNSSRGGKDKRQFRKVGGSNDKVYKSMDARDRIVELADDLNDFNVGGPDSYCGSSFLKQSLSKVHYSVAEAL